jgi:flagellar basal body-associated protein FliL
MKINKNEKGITAIEALIILAVVLLVGAGIYQAFFYEDTENTKTNDKKIEKQKEDTSKELEKVEDASIESEKKEVLKK